MIVNFIHYLQSLQVNFQRGSERSHRSIQLQQGTVDAKGEVQLTGEVECDEV